MHWQPLTVASLALSLGCAPALASGISLPAASFTQTVEAGTCAGFEGDCDPVNAISQTIATAGAQSVAYPGAANLDAAWSSIRARLGPKLTSRAIGAAAGSGLGEAQATYYFQVIGPLALQVPVVFTIAGTLHAAKVPTTALVGGAAASGQIIGNGDRENNSSVIEVSCSAASGGCGHFTRSVAVTVLASSQDSVAPPSAVILTAGSLAVPAYYGVQSFTAQSVFAASVAIDPAWTNPSASQYRIKFSPGIAQQ